MIKPQSAHDERIHLHGYYMSFFLLLSKICRHFGHLLIVGPSQTPNHPSTHFLTIHRQYSIVHLVVDLSSCREMKIDDKEDHGSSASTAYI